MWFSRAVRGSKNSMRGLTCWAGDLLKTRQPDDRLFARSAAHLGRRLQPAAKGRALRLAEHLAAQFFIELYARHPGRLAIRHAGQGRGDGGRDAAGGAVGAAVHGAGLYLRLTPSLSDVLIRLWIGANSGAEIMAMATDANVSDRVRQHDGIQEESERMSSAKHAGERSAVLSYNKPAFYMVPPKRYRSHAGRTQRPCNSCILSQRSALEAKGPRAQR